MNAAEIPSAYNSEDITEFLDSWVVNATINFDLNPGNGIGWCEELFYINLMHFLKNTMVPCSLSENGADKTLLPRQLSKSGSNMLKVSL